MISSFKQDTINALFLFTLDDNTYDYEIQK